MDADRLYFGMVGNGETGALIGPDLAIRWLCLPRFDGTPFFASALDPRRGGQLSIELDERLAAIEQSADGELPAVASRGDSSASRGDSSASRGDSSASRGDSSPDGGSMGGRDVPTGGTTFNGVRVEQRYVGRTNVLSTSLETDIARLHAVDVMPWGKPLLVRRLTVTNTGDRPESFRLTFRADPVRSAHWSFAAAADELPLSDRSADHSSGTEGSTPETRTVVAVDEQDASLVIGWVLGTPDNRAASEPGGGVTAGRGWSTLTLPPLAPSESFNVVLLLAYGRNEAEAKARWSEAAGELAEQPDGDPAGMERELQFWTDWLGRARFPQGVAPDLEEAYARGLLTLKMLTHDPSGAILAAPTASFPAVPGGHDNWDYRFCWLRDGYYTARTYDEAGFHDEARGFYEFALRCQGDDGRWHQPLYTLDGGGPEEHIVDDLEGPGGERPLRFGNAAYDQLQIDNEPSILHGLWIHAQKTKDRAWFAARWDAIRNAAEAMMRLWHRPENGIWEIRERRDHWVYGKALCVAGFRAAAALAEWLGHDDDARRWRSEADTVRAQVVAEGYCPERRAYLQTYDKNSPLDISALALVLWDVLPADDERIRLTVEAMERPLRVPTVTVAASQPTTDDPYWGLHDEKGGLEMGGAFARYDYAAEPFYLPTLWMARYYLRAGLRERAERLVRLCLDNATNLGLMAEHFDPRTGRQWGNFPQAFSHEELALTILELATFE